MYRSVFLGAVAALAVMAGPAAASVSFTWRFDDPVVFGGPDGVFVANGTMTNTGTETLTHVGGAGLNASGIAAYVTDYDNGPTPGDLWSFYDQFDGLSLAPNQSFTFAFANLAYAGAAPGAYTAIADAYILAEAGSEGVYGVASNTVTLKVGVVPEPAAWALMIVGFGGVGAMARLRRTRPLEA